jgi:anhydro-N-acetylmuramic acid kinase
MNGRRQSLKSSHRYHVIGLMSGTSLDGLDVAYCLFEKKKEWKFRILSARTYSYSALWKKKLSTAHELTGESLQELHNAYGRLLGVVCRKFVTQQGIGRLDFIASHGHTVFHQPEKKLTFQLGDGSAIHAAAGWPVIFDFRSLDVAFGGEGAPLVPIGDKLLFSQYDVCLNLGGIANLSMDIKGRRMAFDVCYCNMALNYLMGRIGKPFDNGGKLASSGKTNEILMTGMEQVYANLRQKRPSLSREMFEASVRPMLDHQEISLKDALHTLCESVANEIASALPPSRRKVQMLATGGGVMNTFLIDLLREKLGKRAKVIVPANQIVKFKEALVFAFLGVLRQRNEINVLSSVTHARRDSCSGALIGF